ncbi:MAG: hypothetical protein A3I88_01765 [Candidatus Portnoybacteria bacterium RIFCSPLOWO2_12_FULL_39_9]|nr:MAG: hypothetical protein A2646_03055 [Candidatus Portnoybacteria bacterium RIFCSPHIGHO2_02_FULL_39_12]OGZ37807.1 MAG: hypothetical protein A3F21_02630 [Candidatus Portnoybacteria bacterium RIFCSPLOWO2_01_FULL_38_39]OGZ39768.1 MAG: hypothetical protein A3I88_01765 [Candidatus Portnoybacteria bacterium RIFCSPLOWO2_12_FULL_39_9]
MFYFKVTIRYIFSLMYQMPKMILQGLNKHDQKEERIGQKFVISNQFYEGGGRNGKIRKKTQISILSQHD